MSIVITPERVVSPEMYGETGILFSQFTDGGSAAGTYTCGFTLPVNFNISRVILTNVVGFTGDTTAVITVGDGSDVDRLNAGTPSVFTTVAALNLGVPSGVAAIVTEFRPVLTVTGGADFTSVVAGRLDIQIYGWMVA